jgi:hypothetical protein
MRFLSVVDYRRSKSRGLANQLAQWESNMSVSSVSSSSSLTQTDWRSVTNQLKQDFKQLASSLQSGDLSGAQKAYATLQQLLQSTQSGGPSSNGQQASSTNNPIQNDFAALGKALSNGDLAGAQSAFSQLQTDMQAAAPNSASGAVQSAHHGHHHRHVSSASDSDSDSSTADQTATTGSSGSQSTPTGSTFSIYA